MRFVLGLILLLSCPFGWATPLHEAARTGDGNRVRSQLAAGADINAVDEHGFTPLLLAEISSHPRTAQLLRDNGAVDGLSSLVERLQRYLRHLGHDPGPIDGQLGPGTRAAIRDYQRRVGEPVNGRIREAWVKTLHRQLYRRIQEQLREQGLYEGPTDGLIGPETRGAIRAFQRQAGLTVTGDPNGDWLTRLSTTQSDATRVVSDDTGQPTTERGRIRRLQAALTVLGHDTGGVDGLVGPTTRSAIRDFQRHHDLRVDGGPSAALYNRVDRELTRHIQQRLRALGFDPGPVDGLPGENTRLAVEAFERRQGLPTRGRISPALAARLDAALRNSESAEPTIVLTHQREIRAAQRYLDALGLEPGPIDGEPGPGTRDALRRYQAQAGLPETGELTDRLLSRLAAAATARRAEADDADTPRTRAERIQEIQSRLNSLGYNAGPADGEHGPRSAAAIRSFERHLGLPAQGEPSEAILEKLRTTPLAEAKALPAQGQPVGGGNTEVRGRLLLQHAGGELLGCSISGVQLDRSWCEPFEHHPDTSDCRAVLRPDTRVLMLKCS